MANHKLILAALILIISGSAFCLTGYAEDDIEFVPGEDSGFFYTIKKGDTLWDLSQKFYNSQWDWPGLWEMNKDIKNPHWIYPGNRIKIFLKEEHKLPPKVVKVKKIEKPKEPVKIAASFSLSKMDFIGFIKKSPHPSLGKIIKERDNYLMMSKDDIIYLEPSGRESLVPEETYLVFNTEKVSQGGFSGIKHLIKAKIKIIEQQGQHVKAVITDSYRPVGKGDKIMAYFKRDPVLTVEENPDPIDAKILCSEDNDLMINDYAIAFIDAGKSEVKPGQIYRIFKENQEESAGQWPLSKPSYQKFENIETGKLIILHTEDSASTVMILSSRYAISPDFMVN